jgi:colanic acid biosynthesis glycosyl transferase WcaI
MHILFLAQHYAPEDVSGAALATELSEDLVGRGHKVSFVTCAPNYPKGELFLGYHNRVFSREILNGVEVIRTWSYISPKRSFLTRTLNYSSFSLTAFYGGLLAGKSDIIFSYTTPVTLGISAWLLAELWRIPWILRVEDLFSDAAIAAGVLRDQQVMIRFLTSVERFLYRQATHVSLISEGFRQNLLGKGVPAEKLSVIPVWADPDIVQPLPKKNGFRKKYDLDDKFVVMYAGNMGHASALDEVIEAAELLREKNDILFLLIGEGVKKETLIAKVQNKGLQNISFLPFQPRETFPEMLAAADLSLVTLNARSSGTSLPSKTFNIMASSRPILSITPSNSEIAQLVESTECGVNVIPNQPQLLAETIQTLRSDPVLLRKMGEKGRKHLEECFSRQYCVDRYEMMIKQVVS